MPKEIIWTIEKIREGFEKFHNLHGHYPTDYEINDFQYLPTPRQIQRKKVKLPFNWKIVNIDEFKKEIDLFTPFIEQ